MEAIKFADPIRHKEVINIEENIKEKISILNTLVEEKNSEEIKNICIEIEILLKERATKLITIKWNNKWQEFNAKCVVGI